MVFLAAFVLVPLHDGEVLRVVHALHDEPRDGLLVLGVDGRRLVELRVDLGDVLFARLGAEVDHDRVYHCFGGDKSMRKLVETLIQSRSLCNDAVNCRNRVSER